MKGDLRARAAAWAARASQRAREAAGKLRPLVFGAQEVLGVDIGSWAVKIIGLQDIRGELTVDFWGYMPLDAELEASSETRQALATAALKSFLSLKKPPRRAAATSVSGTSVIVRSVRFPYLTKAELAGSLRTEAEPYIPFDMNDIELAASILGTATEDGQKKVDAALVAAKKDLVSSRLAVLDGAGLSPLIVDVDTFAVERAAALDERSREAGGATILLNLGHSVTNLSIIEGSSSRVARDIMIAGQSASKALIKALGVDYKKAEEIKQQGSVSSLAAPGGEAAEIVAPAGTPEAPQVEELPVETSGAAEALLGTLSDLASEVRRSVDFYLSQGPDRQVARVFLCGGLAKMKGLSQFLSGSLKVPVSVLDPFSALKVPADFPMERAADFAVAVGLALRQRRDWL